VGIGASAGGLEALKRFFAAVPADSGLAYVVVVHLPAERESHLADLLQPHAPIPVMQVVGSTMLESDQVYVVPPGRNLSAVDSHLHLSRLEEWREDRAPIDHFFRTLAESFDGHAVAVVLTGTGSDGAQGVRRIQEKGGVVVVQDPGEAEFDGMPRSALATGVVDLVLPVAEIPGRILEFDRMRPRVKEAAGREMEGEGDRVPRILTQVQARTGQDFSRYKRSTIERRIERRMQLQGIEHLPAYLHLLRESPQEAAALADDLLINVTSFFRDGPVFEYLAQAVVPALFDGKGPESRVRVWSVGCATGEEAYSLGMLLLEEAARRESPPQIQVFASDLHERSLRYAREGLYPETIAADVSPERLHRFFLEENGGYRVRKELRELVVFAPHNLLRDPPFSHLDLVCCRNVLIYLQREVQEEVIDLFHYALHDAGYLLLGTAETVERSDLFRVESKEQHLYRRRNVAGAELRLPRLPLSPAPPLPLAVRTTPAPRADAAAAYGDLHQKMVERFAPPSLLVGADHSVLHVSENAGRYLQVGGGLPSSNVFRLVREELRVELRAALHLAQERGAPSRSKPIPVRIDGEMRSVLLRVSPTGSGETEGLVLVLFEELGMAAAEGEEPERGGAALRELETELEMTKGRLQGLLEEFETSQEEMRASNEELQSANEELRSTMEELETSREELQSINEELQTVNQENRHKVEELSQLSSDLQNLLKSTDVATLFLDRSLRILRFTPRVGELFNVRNTDRGRPLADLTHRLGYGGLLEDAKRVLETLVPAEREVESEDGRWHLVRVMPYRTVEDRIEGVVITLVDVTTLKRTEESLRESEEKYRTLFNSMDEAYAVVEVLADEEGRWNDFLFLEVNPAFLEHTGMPYPVGRTATQLLGTPNPRWAELYGRVAETGDPIRVEERELTLGRIFDLYMFRLGGAGSRRVAVLFTNITARKEAEEALRGSEERFRALVTATSYVIYRMSPDWTEMRRLDGRGFIADTERPSQSWVEEYIDPEDEPRVMAAIREAIRTRSPFELEHRVRQVDGTLGWTLSRAVPIEGENGEITEWIGTASDVTARKQTEVALRELNETLERRVEERTRRIREQEERFRTLVETAALMVWSTNAEGQAVEDSPSWRAFTGQTREEWLADGWAKVVHPEDRSHAYQSWFRSVAKMTPVNMEFRIWHAESRSWRWTNVRAVPLRDEAGVVNGWIGMNIDIDERRRAEEARGEALRQLVSTEEEERRRISRELHDQLGQQLTGLLLGLRGVKDGVESPELAGRVRALEQLATEVSRDMQHLALELRPPRWIRWGSLPPCRATWRSGASGTASSTTSTSRDCRAFASPARWRPPSTGWCRRGSPTCSSTPGRAG
jgi:two-component system CheB/CheR fusion protein